MITKILIILCLIVVLISGVVSILLGIYEITYKEYMIGIYSIIMGTVISITCAFGITYTLLTPKPTEQDVLNGKAVHQETLHINNSDTIKTYKIIWKSSEK